MGLGVVYKAWQVSRNRTVTLKLIRAGAYACPRPLNHFRAAAAATPRHPHVVQVLDVGEQEGQAYLAQEYCPGGSLADHLDGTPLPARQAAQLVGTLARAMHVVHEAGVVHRDLQPRKVLFGEDGRPKVADFDLALRADGAGPVDGGTVVGTPRYMAPEQVTGREDVVGPATDVYALGVILYELLTGRPPFRGADVLATLLQVIAEAPVLPSRLNPRVPRDLEGVCLRCLRKEPDRRYQTARELAEDLDRFQAGGPVPGGPGGVVGRVLGWVKRRRVLARWLGG